MTPTPEEWITIWLSLKVATFSVLFSLPFAIAFAHLLARKEFPGKTVLDAVVHLPLVLPPVAVGYFLLLLLGRRGPIGQFLDQWFGIELAFTWQGAALAAAIMGFPLMVRAIRISIESIDPRLESAARTLGASKLQSLVTVTLPLALPGIIAGIVLGFARALGEFGATITFAGNILGETQTLPTALYTAHETPGGDAAAIRLAIISVFIAFAALMASEWFARRVRRTIQGTGGAE